MLIIPSLELQKGVCTHCIDGEPGTEDLYLDLQTHPEQLIRLLRRENFKALHLIDKDSLLHGKEIDFGLIQRITEAVDIPIQLHADFKSQDECKTALHAGLYRLIISNELMMDFDFCSEIIKEFTASRICFAVIVSEGKLFDKNLRDKFSPAELIHKLALNGAKRILIGTYQSVFEGKEFDLPFDGELFENKHLRYSIYGGINTPEMLWDLNKHKSRNIDSVIIGQAIFRNAFPCQKIWRLIEAELEKS